MMCRGPLVVVFTICALLVALSSATVSACSVRKVLSAAEIVSEADTILLVKVPDEEFVPDESQQEGMPLIPMAVEEVIKGESTDKTIKVRGYTKGYSGKNDQPHSRTR